MGDSSQILTEDRAKKISLKASEAFQPRTPIGTRELFAGRWNQLTSTTDAVNQVGLHVVVYGERGVGKTSLANIIRPLLHVLEDEDDKDPNTKSVERLVIKGNVNRNDSFQSAWRRAFEDIKWRESTQGIGFKGKQDEELRNLSESLGIPNEPSVDDIRRVLSLLPGSVFIFDEFDRMPTSAISSFTDLIKSLSDYSVDSTVILVGVSDTVDGLLKDHASIARSLIQVRMPRMTEEELLAILKKAEEMLGVVFDDNAARQIVKTSQGLPHYTHLLGQYSVREACQMRLQSRILQDDVQKSFDKVVKEAQQSVRTKYATATHSAHKDALYRDVLLACALTAAQVTTTSDDSMGYFQAAAVTPHLQAILPNKIVGVSLFNKHLAEFCDQKRGNVLDRIGPPRGLRYRFRDPLLPPYIIMKAMTDQRITVAHLSAFEFN